VRKKERKNKANSKEIKKEAHTKKEKVYEEKQTKQGRNKELKRERNEEREGRETEIERQKINLTRSLNCNKES
jgi:hypothetical protein